MSGSFLVAGSSAPVDAGAMAGGSLTVIADLLRYPDENFHARAVAIPDFFDEVASVSVDGMQELYTITFDLNPVATLEVGWHLWGEQYERGRFLADLRGIQARLRLEPGTELPDHLTVLLPILERTGDPELGRNVGKALDKIGKPLDEHGNPYRHVIAAAKQAIEELIARSRDSVIQNSALQDFSTSALQD